MTSRSHARLYETPDRGGCWPWRADRRSASAPPAGRSCYHPAAGPACPVTVDVAVKLTKIYAVLLRDLCCALSLRWSGNPICNARLGREGPFGQGLMIRPGEAQRARMRSPPCSTRFETSRKFPSNSTSRVGNRAVAQRGYPMVPQRPSTVIGEGAVLAAVGSCCGDGVRLRVAVCDAPGRRRGVGLRPWTRRRLTWQGRPIGLVSL